MLRVLLLVVGREDDEVGERVAGAEGPMPSSICCTSGPRTACETP